MSFILEALRRADRERKTGTSPDLQTVVELPAELQPRPRWPWVTLAGAVLLGGLVLGLFLWPKTKPEGLATAVTVSPAPAAPQQTPLLAPAVAPVSPARESPPAPTKTNAQADVPPRRVATQPSGKPITAMPPMPPASPGTPAKRYGRDTTVANTPPETDRTIPATSPTGTLPEAEPSVRAPANRLVEATQTGTQVENAADIAMARAAPKAGSAVPARQTPPAPPSAIPLVADLPPTQQQAFAGIQLDAHVYAEDPAERFVLINMRGHRVGDTVGKHGAVLDAITRDGAVLRSGEIRALVPHP